MRALDIPELRIVFILSGVLAFVGWVVATGIVWARDITSLNQNRALCAFGFVLGGGLGWLIGWGIVLLRRALNGSPSDNSADESRQADRQSITLPEDDERAPRR